MQTPAGTDLLLMGYVVGTHGLKGECKIVPETDDPARVLALERVWLGHKENCTHQYDVIASRLHHTKHGVSILMRLEGIPDVDSAAQLRGLDIYAKAADLPPLASGEFYLYNLIGTKVYTDSGFTVGQIKDVWEAPASDVYVIDRPGQRDALIPAVPAIVTSVDTKARRIVIRPIEGLLD